MILQVVSFKDRGRRAFLMALIHHHFEMKALVRDEDHGALLDRHRDPLRRGLRALRRATTRSGRVPGQMQDEGARLRPRPLGRIGSRASPSSGATRWSAVDRTLGMRTPGSLLDGVELVVKSPGVPARARWLVQAARTAGVPVWSELDSAGACSRRRGRASSASPARTGSRRRAELLGAVFRAAGAHVVVGRQHRLGRSTGRARWPGCCLLRGCRVSSSRMSTSSPATLRCCSTWSPTTSTAHGMLQGIPGGEAPVP